MYLENIQDAMQPDIYSDDVIQYVLNKERQEEYEKLVTEIRDYATEYARNSKRSWITPERMQVFLHHIIDSALEKDDLSRNLVTLKDEFIKENFGDIKPARTYYLWGQFKDSVNRKFSRKCS